MRLPVQGAGLEGEKSVLQPGLGGFWVHEEDGGGSQGWKCLQQGERSPSDKLGHGIPESHSATPPATAPPPSAAAFDTLRQHTQAPKPRAPPRNHHPSTRASPPQTWTSREQPQPEESPHCSHGHGHASRGQRQTQLLKSIYAPTHRHSDRHTAVRTWTRSRADRHTNAPLGAARRTHRGGAGWEDQGPDCGHSERPAALPPLPAPVRPALPAAPPHVPRLRLSPRRRRRRTRRTGRREGPGRGCGPAGGGGGSGAEDPPTPRPPPRRPRPPLPHPPGSPNPLEAPAGAASAGGPGSRVNRIPDPGSPIPASGFWLPTALGQGGVVDLRD